MKHLHRTTIVIVHLPCSEYTIEINGKRADEQCDYGTRGIFTVFGSKYVVQTEYFGEACVWDLGEQYSVTEEDRTIIT